MTTSPGIALVAAGMLLGAGLSVSTTHADTSRVLKVSFQTTACNGETGLGSVDVDRIDRIQPIECGPDGAGRKLKQVLVKPAAGATGYQVFTVTEPEAAKIHEQIRRYMETRQKALEKDKTIIIDR